MASVPQPLELFYSYAHEDETLRDALEKHLSMLKREGVITGWHDREITAGREWENQISEHLESAQIILLLISADFLDSDYCYDKEMRRALERHNAGEATVIPIILRSVDWKGAPFSKLQALPKDGKAVTSWSNQDEAFTNIAEGIRKAAQKIRPTDSPHRPLRPPRSQRLLLWALLVVIGLVLSGWFVYRECLNLGRHYAAQHEVEKASWYYNNAIKLYPKAAEAYFGLGVLSYEQGDMREAMKNYEEAVKISDTTPKYVNNLADLYAQQGYYAKAIALYGKLPQTFPIASLEIAHVHRLMGDPLEIAQRLQEKVLELLGNQQIMDQPENQEPWEYRTDQAIITLTELTDKQCYVYYSLAATLYIDGQTADAKAYVKKAHSLERPYERYIKDLVDYDLRRLAEKKSEWQEPINAYRQQFLQ